MDKTFDFKKHEAEIYKKWLDGNMFAARINANKKPFTVIMPPPNITSRLHVGHAFTSTIQDSIIRFKRMQGFEALLLPGADHAAIATEAKVVDELKKQGIEKSSLTREQFMEHIQKWYDYYTPQIIEQFKRLGISCDWSRFSFTMDSHTTQAVKTAFNSLREKGLIYRGERMINWCPHCKTALSDAEVTYTLAPRQIYEIKYGPITVATTRPETIFGDVAVAVNPKDPRYKKYVGTGVSLPLVNRTVPVIADEYVDIKFGTGALKITPAHDHADNQIGAKHNLAPIKVIDEDGNLFGEFVPKQFRGLGTMTARKAVLEALEREKLLVQIKPYSANIGNCYRCHTAVEPAISKQWFVAMKDLAAGCIAALNRPENGLRIIPKKYEKTYLNWLYNIKDWCISRQLLSGHRIPVDGDNDVLDTWFSSALWPFCTLGWPNTNAPDFRYFYPTNVMVTAYDILFFWVIRMVFSGLEHTGKVPFNTVLFHGLVRDLNGKKMSKSLGNGVDPIEVIDKYGTDALRFSLICGTKPDRDPRYGTEKAELARNFINKIWNATKFCLSLQEQVSTTGNKQLSLADKWILTKLQTVIKSTTRRYEKFDFGIAANELQQFFWNDVCDWYIEAAKVAPNSAVAAHVIKTFLKLINPIMPFVTEHIYCTEMAAANTLLYEVFPMEDKKQNYPKEKKLFDRLINLVQTIRTAKRENPNFKGIIVEKEWIQHKALIEKLGAVQVEFGEKFELKKDAEAEQKRISEQIEYLKTEIARSEKMLGNPGFTAKAPKALVDAERQKLDKNFKLLKSLKANGLMSRGEL